MQNGHAQAEYSFSLDLFFGLEFHLKIAYLFRRVIITLIVHAPIVPINQISVHNLQSPLRNNKDHIRWQTHHLLFREQSIDTTLKDTEQLHFLERFVFFLPGVDLIDQFDFGILIDRIYFIEIWTDVVMFLGPYFDQLQYILAIVVAATGYHFESTLVFLPR